MSIVGKGADSPGLLKIKVFGKINVKKGLGKIIVKKGWVKNGWVKSWSGKIGAAIISRSNF